jgi:hypothetical protein
MIDPHCAAKPSELGTASHADVLTGIDELTGRAIAERACSAAQPVPRFNYAYAQTAQRQSLGRGQTRQAGADNQDRLQ